jgi:flavin reductase (DIM6/NTAB) family NADH-FMN oxidoreductase RutF
MRRDVVPDPASSRTFYRFLTSVVVPRPIAWVSSTSADGVDNLAPHSFFTVASVNPPIVQFTSVGRKDSVRNIEATGEFVVSFTPEDLFEAVNATGTNFPPDVSEFDAVGLTREPSATVRPPRVLESPVALECRLHLIQEMGDCTLVFGEVLHAVVSEDVLDGDLPAIDALKPLSRLGRNEWGTAGRIRTITRIPVGEWPGHYDAPEASDAQ